MSIFVKYNNEWKKVEKKEIESINIYSFDKYEPYLHKINSADMTSAGKYNTGDSGSIESFCYDSTGYIYIAVKYYDPDGSSYEIHKINPETMTQEKSAYTQHTDSVDSIVRDSDIYLYMGSADNTLHKINIIYFTQAGTFTESSSTILGVVWGDDDYLYAFNSDGVLYKIDPSTMDSVNSYAGRGNGNQGYLLYYQGYLYYSIWLDLYESYIDKINPSDMTVADSISHGNNGWMIIGSDGYLYDGGSSISKINMTDMTLVNEYTLDPSVFEDASYGDDGYLYACGTHNKIQKFDPADMTLVDEYNQGSTVNAVHYGPDGYIYAGGFNNAVEKINPSNMTLVSSYAQEDTIENRSIFSII